MSDSPWLKPLGSLVWIDVSDYKRQKYTLRIDMRLEFEWDEHKARANLQKHGVSFQEASTIFEDPQLVTFNNEAHSTYEDRFISIGISMPMRLLVVVHTDRAERIRIISARVATRREQSTYEYR